MISFEDSVINNTVSKLLLGKDYREEVVNAINASFFDFTIDFFKKIVKAKMELQNITIDWYKKNFIINNTIDTSEVVINSGLNKKTVTNIYGAASKNIMLNAAETNYDYLNSLLKELEKDVRNDIIININIKYNDISVSLSLSESLIVINTLATKKIQLRGGAWSSIGKKVEKPLLNKLCELCGIPNDYIDNKNFIKDKEKSFDREIDYKLKSFSGKWYKIEVKLMGKGNPESADATIARDSDIFVADTLSQQNKNQLKSRNIKYLVLKNNKNIISDFKEILIKLEIPHN
jgi:putative type II site-specific deoxyribonuclease